jgi:uncharacterized protein (TIGR03435 family)
MNILRVSLTILLLAVICIGCGKKSDPKELSKVEGVSIQYAEYNATTRWGAQSNGEYIAESMKFEKILKSMWPQGQIDVEKTNVFAGKFFNFKIKGNGETLSRQAYWEKFKDAFEKSFDISISKKSKLMEMKVISRGEGDLKISKVEGRSGSSSGTSMNGYRFNSSSINDLARTFQWILGMKVINKTGLKGKYDFEIKLDMDKPETFSDGFKQLGLKLSDDKREFEVIVVERLIK